jgi:hypothetical protein
LHKRGIITVFDVAEDGSYLLHISTFKKESQITAALAEANVLAEITRPEKDTQNKAVRWLKEHTLKTAGFLYLIGDIALFVSGYLSGRKKEVSAGLMYASGGAVSAFYGSPSLSREIKNTGIEMGDFLVQQGADIPRQSALHTLMLQRRGGLIERAEQFLYRHPSEIHNLIYAYGGTKLLQSGFAKSASQYSVKRAGWWEDMAAGGLVTGAGLVGGLITEKQGKENNASNGVWHWVKEKPLRLAGYLYTLNNVFLIKSAWKEWKSNPAQRSYIFKFVTAGVFLIANTFMSLTSRTHSATGKKAVDKRHILEGLAAEVIAAQPENLREAMIRKVAGFLSTHPETKQDLSALETTLTRKVTAFHTSPWHIAALPAISVQPAQQKTTAQQRSASLWQEKTRTVNLVPAQGVGL